MRLKKRNCVEVFTEMVECNCREVTYIFYNEKGRKKVMCSVYQGYVRPEYTMSDAYLHTAGHISRQTYNKCFAEALFDAAYTCHKWQDDKGREVNKVLPVTDSHTMMMPLKFVKAGDDSTN